MTSVSAKGRSDLCRRQAWRGLSHPAPQGRCHFQGGGREGQVEKKERCITSGVARKGRGAGADEGALGRRL